MIDTYLKHALPEVLSFEGGFSDDPNDSGGATNYGITQAEYDAHRRLCGEAPQSVRYITMPEVDNIYRNNYWVPVHGDDLPFPLDWLTFDAQVNGGPGMGIDLLEKALGDTPDGSISPAVIAQAKAACATLAGTHALKTEELALRIDRYRAIVAEHAKDNVFLQGWLNRVEELRAAS